jgi:glutathione S-transferase
MADQRILYGADDSGHVHRVRLLLDMLELPYRYVVASAEERRSAEYLALNPLGQIPVLQDGAVVLADSNAILVYLALSYDRERVWLPAEPVTAAQVQRWLSIAAGEIRFGPATARAIAQWGAPGDAAQAAAISRRLLGFMESHLAERHWLAAEHATIADLAAYAYVAHAPEGGVKLRGFAAVRAWIDRVRALPKFTPMIELPVPAPSGA